MNGNDINVFLSEYRYLREKATSKKFMILEREWEVNWSTEIVWKIRNQQKNFIKINCVLAWNKWIKQCDENLKNTKFIAPEIERNKKEKKNLHISVSKRVESCLKATIKKTKFEKKIANPIITGNKLNTFESELPHLQHILCRNHSASKSKNIAIENF